MSRTVRRRTSDLSVPLWPEITAEEKREALSAGWPQRVRGALLFAAVLALLAAAITYLPERDFSWRVGVSLALCVACLAAYLQVDIYALPAHWLAGAGLVTIAATQINLMTCVAERALAKPANQAVVEPALLLIALVTGSIWALRIDLAWEGFAAASALTAGILWLPWMILTGAPFELAVLAGACFATGVLLRGFAAERAYDAYKRDVVWPRLWREGVRLEVELQMLELDAAIQNPVEPFSEDERDEWSVAQLARALASCNPRPHEIELGLE